MLFSEILLNILGRIAWTIQLGKKPMNDSYADYGRQVIIQTLSWIFILLCIIGIGVVIMGLLKSILVTN